MSWRRERKAQAKLHQVTVHWQHHAFGQHGLFINQQSQSLSPLTAVAMETVAGSLGVYLVASCWGKLSSSCMPRCSVLYSPT